MKKYKIILDSINDVKHFVNAATEQLFDIDIVSGRYVVDAKSIMGIFSIDLTKPIEIEVHGSEDEAAEFYEKIKQYEIK